MQNYTEISSTTKLTDSLAQILNNDKSIMSDFSGTAFPTTNLQEGMRCFRTDQNKLYRLASTGPDTWALLIDYAKTIAYTDDVNTARDSRVAKAGDTMTGALTVKAATGTNGWVLQDSAGVLKGSLYWDAAGWGMLNSLGQWALRSEASNGGVFCGGSFTASGNVSGYSDERLKEDWKAFAPDFTERLAQIKYGTFTRIDTGNREVGVGAQSLQVILKEAVQKNIQHDEEGNVTGDVLSVTYGNAALAVCAHLAAEIVKLKERLAAVEGK